MEIQPLICPKSFDAVRRHILSFARALRAIEASGVTPRAEIDALENDAATEMVFEFHRLLTREAR